MSALEEAVADYENKIKSIDNEISKLQWKRDNLVNALNQKRMELAVSGGMFKNILWDGYASAGSRLRAIGPCGDIENIQSLFKHYYHGQSVVDKLWFSDSNRQMLPNNIADSTVELVSSDERLEIHYNNAEHLFSFIKKHGLKLSSSMLEGAVRRQEEAVLREQESLKSMRRQLNEYTRLIRQSE